MKHSKFEQDQFFNEIYVEMYEEIYRYIRRMNYDNRMLEDILQETFYEAYKKIDILMEHENYRGWIYKTAKYKILKSNYYIHKTDETEVELNDSQVQIPNVTKDDNFIAYEEYKEVLTEKEFNFIMKHYVEGYTYKELAEQENVNVGACKMRASRIIKKLRKAIIS